jgi:hypothetical protein
MELIVAMVFYVDTCMVLLACIGERGTVECLQRFSPGPAASTRYRA